MVTRKSNGLVEVFAGSPIDAVIVRSLLIDSDIEAFLKDENMGTLAPWQTSPGGAGAVKVIISSFDFERAKLIVEDYEQNKNSSR